MEKNISDEKEERGLSKDAYLTKKKITLTHFNKYWNHVYKKKLNNYYKCRVIKSKDKKRIKRWLKIH